MDPQDAIAFLTDCIKWINSSSEDIQGGKELAQEMQAAIDNGAAQEMAGRIQEMAKPLESDYLQALGNSEVFNGVKDALGKTTDVIFSPAALTGVKIAVGALAGPIGAGIAVAAGVAEISAAAYDINRLNVLHDEACHLKEYAEYKELNQKLIEDITLQCQRNDPSITAEEIENTLKEIGVITQGTSQNQTASKETELPEAEQSSLKETMAKNLAINSVILLAAKNPATFISMANPISMGIDAAVAIGRSAAMSVGEINEEDANKRTLHTIEERRKTGPEYKTYTDLDPESAEYQGNLAKNKLRRLVGAEETDPTKSEISRKYDLADSALRERLTAETLNDLSQDSSFIEKITNSIQLQRQESAIEIPKDLESQLATKERELIEFEAKTKELLEVEKELKKYGPNQLETLYAHAGDRLQSEEKLNEIMQKLEDIDLTEQEQRSLSAEVFLLQNEIYNSLANDEKLKALMRRQEELTKYFHNQPSITEKEIENLKQSIAQQLNPQTQALAEAKQKAQEHIDTSIAALDLYKAQDTIKYDKLDSLIKEQEKLEEYSLILNKRQRELSTDHSQNSDEIAKNTKKLKKNEQKIMDLEQDLLEHAALASYKQKIQDGNNVLIAIGEKLEISSPEEQTKLSQEISYLQDTIRENTKKHDQLEAAIIKKDLLKQSFQERNTKLQEKMMDISIQAKEAELKKKEAEIQAIESRLKTEGGLSDYYLKDENSHLLPTSFYKDGIKRDTKNLETIKDKIARGERDDPNSTPLQEQAWHRQQSIAEYRTQDKIFGPLLEARKQLKESLTKLSSDIEQLKREKEDFHLDLPREAIKTDLIIQQMDLRGTHFDQAKETGLYTSEQLRKDTYESVTADGEQVTKTDYSKWAESSGRNLKKAFTSRENERSTYEAIQQHEREFDAHITQQKDRVDASITHSKQKIMNSLATAISEKETSPEDLIDRINELDKTTFNLKINGKTLVEHLEQEGADPTVLEAAKAKESKYKQEDLETELAPEALQTVIDKPIEQTTSQKPEKLPEEIEKKDKKQGPTKAQQKEMNALVQMLNDYSKDGKMTSLAESEKMAAYINKMDPDALKIPIGDKSLIELIAERNAGSHAMAAALNKNVFTKEQIIKATAKLKDVKKLAPGIAAVKSWKRRNTTEKKLNTMREFLENQDKFLNSPVSTPNLKSSVAKGMRSLV